MSPGVAPESWDQWTSRVTAELAGLAEGEWLTVTAATSGASGSTGTPAGSAPYAAGSPERERRWSLRRGSSRPAGRRDPMPDVFLQASLLEGVLALECISDTEFEGLSDLSAEQEQALVALGWKQDGHEPAFHRTYARESVGTDTTAHTRDTARPGGAESMEITASAGSVKGLGRAAEAARLLRDSLERVLGAFSPDDVVIRRSLKGVGNG